MKQFLFLLAQFLLPHHLVSRIAGAIAECRWDLIKNPMIKRFVDAYGVDMSQAQETDPTAYDNFNAFFTRALKTDARTLVTEANAIACPVDGVISQLGSIEQGRIFQAKGHSFSTRELLGGDGDLAAQFDQGVFTTLYLSPRDYHRVHMPVDGRLTHSVYVPGRLFSVSPLTTREISGLFARNERLVALFDTPIGPMAMVMVGAMIVGSIETVWNGVVTPPQRKIKQLRHDQWVDLRRGDEMGRFKLGSTVILLFGNEAAQWSNDLAADAAVTMGQLLANASKPVVAR